MAPQHPAGDSNLTTCGAVAPRREVMLDLVRPLLGRHEIADHALANWADQARIAPTLQVVLGDGLDVDGHVEGPAHAETQLQALQRRLRIVARRVVLPVLPHAQRSVQLALASLVFAVRRARGNLQHEVRTLGLLPQPVAGAIGARHAQHHEHVRRHHRPRIPLLVVQQQVAGHVHVPAAAKPQ